MELTIHTSTRLKLWTIACHFFIVIAGGHGLIILGFYEYFSIGALIDPNTRFGETGLALKYQRLVVMGSLFGQIALVRSILTPKPKRKMYLHLAGLLFLWWSIAAFKIGLDQKDGLFMSWFFCAPLLCCTLWVLKPWILAPFKRTNKWMDS